MTAPSSSPRGERPGRPGTAWETELRGTGERVVPGNEPQPRANRAARRAASRGPRAAVSAPEARSAPQAHPAPERPSGGRSALRADLDARIRDVLLLQLPGRRMSIRATHELADWLIDQATDIAAQHTDH